MSEFVIFHPGTGTFVAADDSVLIRIDDLPAEFDEWEEYLQDFGHNPVPAWTIAKGDEL